MSTPVCLPDSLHARATMFGLFLTAAGSLMTATSAFAADSGPTVTGDVCLQQIFGTPVSNANRVNCTANDIRLSQVISVNPAECISGSTFDLTATYRINVTANSRYDAGFIFRIDGGANARGGDPSADELCSLSALTPPPPANAPALNLDGDTCGDLNSGIYEVTFTIPDVECSDSDGDGKLNLPYCTSWHSNHGTQCDISAPSFSVLDAPDFSPDTKSKCVCDDNFEVPVTVEDVELGVEKSANPEQVPEPGGQVTFTVDIENTGSVESVVITTIDDDIFGDLTDAANPDVEDNTCPDLVGETLAPQATLSCSFKGGVFGNAGDTHTNTVDACAEQESNSSETCGDDDADVDITDVYEAPTVQKTAQAIDNCQVDVSYQVVVSNNSESDVLTLNSLSDDMFGDVASVQGDVISTTCELPQDIDPLDNYTCSFIGRITDDDECEVNHTNEITAGTIDDDGQETSPTDDATVTVTSTP